MSQRLGKYFIDHISVHDGQTAVNAVTAERQECVVDPKQVQNVGGHTRDMAVGITVGLQACRLRMYSCFAKQVVNKSELVIYIAQWCNYVARYFSRLTVGLKTEQALHPATEPIPRCLDILAKVGWLPMMLGQQRFVIP